MATLLCIACGCLAGIAVWVLLLPADVASMWARVLCRAGRRALAKAAESRVTGSLLAFGPLGDAAGAMARHAPGSVSPLAREEAALLLLAGIVLASVLLGVLAQSLVVALVVPVVAVVGLRLCMAERKRRDEGALADEMPGVLRMLASALESGQTLMQAMDYVGLHERGPAAMPFVRASLRLRCGASPDEALAGLADELQAPGVSLMTTALSISQRTGSPLRDLLRRSAVLVERQREFERLLMVRTAQVRLSVRIVCGLPPLMVCLLSLISPDFRQGLATGAGVTSLALATAMDGLAILLIRRIMGGVL